MLEGLGGLGFRGLGLRVWEFGDEKKLKRFRVHVPYRDS